MVQLSSVLLSVCALCACGRLLLTVAVQSVAVLCVRRRERGVGGCETVVCVCVYVCVCVCVCV